MASGSPPPPSRPRTWVSSMELRQHFRAGSRSSSSSSSATSPPPSPVDDFRRVAACHLEAPRGGGSSGQAIFVSLDEDLAKCLQASGWHVSQRPLVLVTNHHLIPSLSHIKDYRLHLGSDRPIKLNEGRFTDCLSCCGQKGLWHHVPHLNQPPSAEDRTYCPTGTDFTILFPNEALVIEVINKRDLWFPVMVDLEHHLLQETLRENRFYVLYRDETGIVRREEIHLQPIAIAAENLDLLESQVDRYREGCKLRYEAYDLGPGQLTCSGAGILCCGQLHGQRELMLLGIHIGCADNGTGHNGVTLHSVFHPISGGRCGVVPALSQLKTARVHNCMTARWFECLKECIKPSEDAEPPQLGTLLQILDFLVRTEPKILRMELGDQAVLLATLELLHVIFERFGQFGGLLPISTEMGRVIPLASQEAFMGSLRDLSVQFCELLWRAHQENEHRVVQACFSCWLHMCSYGDPVRAILHDGAKMSNLRRVRDDHQYEGSAAIHRLFGDICLVHQAHLRCEIHKMADEEAEKKQLEQTRQQERHAESLAQVQADAERAEHNGQQEMAAIKAELDKALEKCQEEKEMTTQIRQQLDVVTVERNSLQAELHGVSEIAELLRRQAGENEIQARDQQSKIDDLQARLNELEGQLHVAENGIRHQRAYSADAAACYKSKSRKPSLLTPDKDKDFWKRDISSVLRRDSVLLEKIGEQFQKVDGAQGCNWEDLLSHLERTVGIKMLADQLESKPPGNIVLLIAQEWEKKEAVPVSNFCDVATSLGNCRVKEYLQEIHVKTTTSPFSAFSDLDPDKDSSTSAI